jgi:hypothetical protein
MRLKTGAGGALAWASAASRIERLPDRLSDNINPIGGSQQSAGGARSRRAERALSAKVGGEP